MMDVTFYHQVRADGGRRTGLSVGDDRGIERFVEPADPDNYDPALRWYVDVTWDVTDPPATQTEARAWLAAKLPELRSVLETTADELSAGIDGDWSTRVNEIATALGTARVSVSAQRRYDGAVVADCIRAALAEDLDALAAEDVAACATG